MILQEKLWKARTEWFNIGIQLHIQYTDLDAIRIKFGKDPGVCFTEMLQHWLNSKTRTKLKPTWKAILEALKSNVIGLGSIAEKVECYLQGESDRSVESSLIGSGRDHLTLRGKHLHKWLFYIWLRLQVTVC